MVLLPHLKLAEKTLLKSASSICILLMLIIPHKIYAADWYYPMDHYFERQTVKGFGTLVNDAFYKDKEQLFPYNRFVGLHAGVDLETLADELNKLLPVYAVGDGTITYIGSLSGYGGVILEKLDNIDHAALYGHVKIKNLPYKVGDHINSGQILTYLGDAFSDETSKERKHLHFAIHKGVDLYFHGHEANLDILHSKWEDPSDYLKSRNALPIPTASAKTVAKSHSIVYTIIKRFLLFLGIK